MFCLIFQYFSGFYFLSFVFALIVLAFSPFFYVVSFDGRYPLLAPKTGASVSGKQWNGSSRGSRDPSAVTLTGYGSR